MSFLAYRTGSHDDFLLGYISRVCDVMQSMPSIASYMDFDFKLLVQATWISKVEFAR